jgi:gamma-glutamyltranspeptidase/glutathione hydrolase
VHAPGLADGRRYIADPSMTPVPLAELLDPAYAARRRAEIDRARANPSVPPGIFAGRDTVYLSAADAYGNACSFINSLYYGFGTGIVVPGAGIALQNRGACFSLDDGHPNRLQPGKRPYHTIIPAMATRGDELYASFGVMGGYMQPQGHFQVFSRLHDGPTRSARSTCRASAWKRVRRACVAREGIADDVCGSGARGHTVGGKPASHADVGGGWVIAARRDSGAGRAGSDLQRRRGRAGGVGRKC